MFVRHDFQFKTDKNIFISHHIITFHRNLAYFSRNKLQLFQSFDVELDSQKNCYELKQFIIQ